MALARADSLTVPRMIFTSLPTRITSTPAGSPPSKPNLRAISSLPLTRSWQLAPGQIESEDNFRFAGYCKVDVRSTPLLATPLLNGLNIAADLFQVRKVVTGQQSQHNFQGFRPALIVLAGAP
jgi:hypothetical protein